MVRIAFRPQIIPISSLMTRKHIFEVMNSDTLKGWLFILKQLYF